MGRSVGRSIDRSVGRLVGWSVGRSVLFPGDRLCLYNSSVDGDTNHSSFHPSTRDGVTVCEHCDHRRDTVHPVAEHY